MQVSEKHEWKQLENHRNRIGKMSLDKLFSEDAQRFDRFSVENKHLLYDFSKQKLDKSVLQDLCKLAISCELHDKIEDLFNGVQFNSAEDIGALHTRLRAKVLNSEVELVLKQMAKFVSDIHQGNYLGITGQRIEYVVSLGIGGSDLGPLMACEALKNFNRANLVIHFVSNVDPQTISLLLNKLPPNKTICLINSKTFTTLETLENAKIFKIWFEKHLGENAISQHMLAVTASHKRAEDFGIFSRNIFKFWDWVCGRYSLWSAVGLSLALIIGFDNFKDFLLGAYQMDEHFRREKFYKNIPVLMGLLGIWNINFLGYPTLGVIPYLDGLTHFPSYLQQLEMESNGKLVTKAGEYVGYNTAPIIWGGVGCNGQHTYMQLLHQGTQIVPVDFIASVKVQGHENLLVHQRMLLASCLSQSQALMTGRSELILEETLNSRLIQAKMCPGNKPSSTILFPELTPLVLGNLIALYEHKVFVQGIIWQIQSFDQWGVELGKQLTKEILPDLCSGKIGDSDSSTSGLLKYIYKQQLSTDVEFSK